MVYIVRCIQSGQCTARNSSELFVYRYEWHCSGWHLCMFITRVSRRCEIKRSLAWWHHDMETLSALLPCAWPVNSLHNPVNIRVLDGILLWYCCRLVTGFVPVSYFRYRDVTQDYRFTDRSVTVHYRILIQNTTYSVQIQYWAVLYWCSYLVCSKKLVKTILFYYTNSINIIRGNTVIVSSYRVQYKSNTKTV